MYYFCTVRVTYKSDENFGDIWTAVRKLQEFLDFCCPSQIVYLVEFANFLWNLKSLKLWNIFLISRLINFRLIPWNLIARHRQRLRIKSILNNLSLVCISASNDKDRLKLRATACVTCLLSTNTRQILEWIF